MRGKNKVLIFSVLILAMFSLAFVEAAGEKCGITTRSECSSSGGYAIMGLSGASNAHGEMYSSSVYSNVLCCNFGNGVQSDECSQSGSAKLLRLSSSTNAHAQTTSQSTYSNQVCYKGGSGFNFYCLPVTSGNCPSGYNSILSLSSSTNAHIGGPNDYATKICCNVEYGTVTQPPTTQPSVYWHSSYAGYFGEPMDEISVDLGNSVYLIGKNLTAYKSQSVTIEIYESDWYWHLPSYDDKIITKSATVDYNGVLSTTNWVVTEEDLLETGEYTSPTSYSFDEFYFIVKNAAGTTIATSNDLTLTIIPPETTPPEEGECTGTATPCSSFTTQSPCDSQLGCYWVVVFAGYPPQGYCNTLNGATPCTSIFNETACEAQLECNWGEGTEEEPAGYWSEFAIGDEINEPITRELNERVYLLGKNLSFYEDATLYLEIYERDLGYWPDYNDLIRTETAVVSGGEISTYWTITQDDLDETGESQEGGPDSFEEFYFVIKDDSDFVIATSNDLDLTISREEIDDGEDDDDDGSSIECLTIDFCSDYDDETNCEEDLCNAAGVITQVNCSDPGIECMCWWNSEEDSCNDGWGVTNGTDSGTCQITQNTADDCSDGFLSFSWVGTWIGTIIPAEKAKCEAGGSETIPCPAQIQLPFFSVGNVIAIILLAIIIYLIISLRKKSVTGKRKSNSRKR